VFNEKCLYHLKVKSLVTGAAGFIGSHLSEKLIELGHEVLGIDNLSVGRIENLENIINNKNFRFMTLDISDFQQVKEIQLNFDYIFHLAALADIVPSIKNPEAYFVSNCNGTLNMLQVAKQIPLKKFIYSASSSCYGIPDVYPTPETSRIQPEYPYALTKYIGELTVLHWQKVFRIPAISLRLFNVYGPRARTSGTYGAVFGVFLAQKLSGKPLTVVGDGNQTRDFTYVTDVVEAFIAAALSKSTHGIFNVGSGGTYSVNQLVDLIEGEITHIPKRPGEPDCTFADISKIKQELGWNPKVSFEKGVQELLSQLQYWKDAPVWTPESIEKETSLWFKYLKENELH
jgi:UDP-glucose 4-epimerase